MIHSIKKFHLTEKQLDSNNYSSFTTEKSTSKGLKDDGAIIVNIPQKIYKQEVEKNLNEMSNKFDCLHQFLSPMNKSNMVLRFTTKRGEKYEPKEFLNKTFKSNQFKKKSRSTYLPDVPGKLWTHKVSTI